MNDQWWRHPEVAADVYRTLGHINDARKRSSSGRDSELWVAEGMTKAFETLARTHNVIRSRERCEDAATYSAALGGLLNDCSSEDRGWLLDQQSVRDLCAFLPLICDDSMIQHQLASEPVSEDLMIKQTAGHREFVECWVRWNEDRSRDEKALRKLGRVLQMFRNNLHHAMKVRTERDLAIAALMVRIYEDCIDAVLDHPERRLLVYGTLAPGQPNYELLGSLSGEWTRVEVSGHFGQDKGVPTFMCDRLAPLEQVHLLCSDDLLRVWERVDEFEGPRYPRHLAVYVADDALLSVANIYEYADTGT